MKVPLVIVVAAVSVSAGSVLLSGVLTPFLFGPTLGKNSVPEAEGARLPFDIIEHFSEKRVEGDDQPGSFIKINDEFVDPEQHCEFCTRVEYTPAATGLAGFAYASENAIDFTGAKKIQFWAMGEDGDERVKFKVGGKSLTTIEDNGPHDKALSIFKSEKFALTSGEVSLEKDWKKYQVDLEGADLEAITHPFAIAFVKAPGEKTQVLYIKGIVIDDAPVDPRYVVETTADNTSGVATAG